MKRLSPVVALVLLLAVAAWGQDKKPNQVSEFMQQKLPCAQEVLEGLVLEDYEKIAVNAQKLSLLSLDSTWQVVQTDEYAEQSAEFRRAALAMAKAADEKNLDAVALAYVETTMKCVKCHNYTCAIRPARPHPQERNKLIGETAHAVVRELPGEC